MADRSEAAKPADPLAIAIFSEISTLDQLMRARLAKALPKGMEISHFVVLTTLAMSARERSPAQLARQHHVTKAAMTNTLTRLETAGFVHIRPDWDDGRRKLVSISPSGAQAREEAADAVAPLFEDALRQLSQEDRRFLLPVLQRLRTFMLD